MGCLECDRAGCGNYMCDRLSHEYNAYLCDECFDELVDLGAETNVREFLDTPKAPVSQEKRRESALARFEVEFPKRRENV